MTGILPNPPSFDDSGDDLFDDDGTWDSPARICTLGIAMPVLIVGVIAYGLLHGRFYTWSDRSHPGFLIRSLPIADVPEGAVAMMTLQVAAALCLFVHFVIGNHPRLGWHTGLITVGIIVVTALVLLGSLVFALTG